MASAYPNPGPQWTPSQCSCMDCDSVHCFTRRHEAQSQCHCEKCYNSKTCFFFNQNHDEVKPTQFDDLEIIPDAKRHSSTSSANIDIIEQRLNSMKTSMFTTESLKTQNEDFKIKSNIKRHSYTSNENIDIIEQRLNAIKTPMFTTESLKTQSEDLKIEADIKSHSYTSNENMDIIEQRLNSIKTPMFTTESLKTQSEDLKIEADIKSHSYTSNVNIDTIEQRLNAIKTPVFTTESLKPQSEDLKIKADIKKHSYTSNANIDIVEQRLNNIKTPVFSTESIITKPSNTDLAILDVEKNDRSIENLGNCLNVSDNVSDSAVNVRKHPIKDYLRTELYSLAGNTDAYDLSLKKSNLSKDNYVVNDHSRGMIKKSQCRKDVEARLRSFISKTTFDEMYRRKEATVLNNVEVTNMPENGTLHSMEKLTAQVMNLPYEDFRESVLPSRTMQSRTQTEITRFDILKRIKEAYNACSCKVCECISSIAAPIFDKEAGNSCNCAPCDCIECTKYRFAGQGVTQIALQSKYQTNGIVNCKCKPCECDECQYYSSDKIISRISIKQCNYSPFQCTECETLGVDQNRTLIVASVGEDNQTPYCACGSPCGCFDCAHPYGTMAQTMTQTQAVTQEMSTGTGATQHMNCACSPCNNVNCEQEGANTCNCDRYNKVVRKPVQNDNNDYDIRRVMISNIFNAKKLQCIDSDIEDSMTSFDSLFKIFSRDVMNSCKVSSDKCNKDDVFTPSCPSNNCVDLRKTQKAPNMLHICDCKPCECQDCKAYNLIEIQTTKDSSYQNSNINYSESFISSNETSLFQRHMQSKDLCNCKPSDYYERQHKDLKNLLTTEAPKSSIYGRLLSDDYLNHLIYLERNGYSTVDRSKKESTALVYICEYGYASHNNNQKKSIRYINETIASRTTIISESNNHGKFAKKYALPYSTITYLSPSINQDTHQIYKEKNRYNSNSNNKYVNWKPKETSIETSYNKNINKLNRNQNKNLTNVRLMKGNRNNIFNAVVPRTTYGVQRNEIDIFENPKCQQISGTAVKMLKKPVPGTITYAKLCKKCYEMMPCSCDSNSNYSRSSLTCPMPSKPTCLQCRHCTCSTCECMSECLKQEIFKKGQLTQTSWTILTNYDRHIEISDNYIPPAFYQINTVLKHKIPRSLKQLPPKDYPQSSLSKNETKLPRDIRYIQSRETNICYSSLPEDNSIILTESKLDYNKVNITLAKAKAYSFELQKVLDKYEKANREFESISTKFKQLRVPTLSFTNVLIDQKNIQKTTEVKKLFENLENDTDQCKTIISNPKKIPGSLLPRDEQERKIMTPEDQAYSKVDHEHSKNQIGNNDLHTNTVKDRTFENLQRDTHQCKIKIYNPKKIPESLLSRNEKERKARKPEDKIIKNNKVQSYPKVDHEQSQNHTETNDLLHLTVKGEETFENLQHDTNHQCKTKINNPKKIPESLLSRNEKERKGRKPEDQAISGHRPEISSNQNKNLKTNKKPITNAPKPFKRLNLNKMRLIAPSSDQLAKRPNKAKKYSNPVNENKSYEIQSKNNTNEILKTFENKNSEMQFKNNTSEILKTPENEDKNSEILFKNNTSDMLKYTETKNSEIQSKNSTSELLKNVENENKNSEIHFNINTSEMFENTEYKNKNSGLQSKNNTSRMLKNTESENKNSELCFKSNTSQMLKNTKKGNNNSVIISKNNTSDMSKNTENDNKNSEIHFKSNTSEMSKNTHNGNNISQIQSENNTENENKNSETQFKNNTSEMLKNTDNENKNSKIQSKNNTSEMLKKQMFTDKTTEFEPVMSEISEFLSDHYDNERIDEIINKFTTNIHTDSRNNTNKPSIKNEKTFMAHTLENTNKMNHVQKTTKNRLSLKFLNVLNYVKKFHPNMYDEIVNLPQYKSALVSTESLLILKDVEDEDLTKNLSNHMQLKAVETKYHVPKIDPIGVRIDAIKDLYGKIFRVDKICTKYQDYQKKIGPSSDIEQKIKSALDVLFSKESIKKLKENYHSQIASKKQMCSVNTETIDGNKKYILNPDIRDQTQEDLIKQYLESFKDKTDKLPYGGEALKSIRVELKKILELPELSNLLECVKSSNTRKTMSTTVSKPKDNDDQVSTDQAMFRKQEKMSQIERNLPKNKIDKMFEMDVAKDKIGACDKNNNLSQVVSHHAFQQHLFSGEWISHSKTANSQIDKHTSGIVKPPKEKCFDTNDIIVKPPKDKCLNTNEIIVEAPKNKCLDTKDIIVKAPINKSLGSNDIAVKAHTKDKCLVTVHSIKSAQAPPNNRNITFDVVRKVSDHTIFVKWKPPKKAQDIRGYELLVDGKSVQKLSSKKNLAVVTCLPNKNKITLTVQSITDASDHPSTTVVYRRGGDRQWVPLSADNLH